MDLFSDGLFDCEWTGSGGLNVLFRRGKRFVPDNQNHTQIGNITLDYAASLSFSRNGNPVQINNTNTYLSVYGWTRASPGNGNRLVEWYIIESLGEYNPGSAEGGASLGTLEINDSIYDIYRATSNGPHIAGSGAFIKYFSIRRGNRTSGFVDVSAHFNKWQELGMDMSGGLYEVTLKVEAFHQNNNPNGTFSGQASITKNNITITPP